MKKDVVERVEEEINSKRKLSKTSKSVVVSKVILNYIVSILVMIYFILMVLGNIYLDKGLFILECRISSFAFLLITVILFENSYKKEKGETAIYGIEMMLISIFTLFIPYMFYELDSNTTFYIKLTGIYISIYYFIKAIIVYKYEKKKQLRSLSDIKEIVTKWNKKEIQSKQEEIIKEEKEIRKDEKTDNKVVKETVSKGIKKGEPAKKTRSGKHSKIEEPKQKSAKFKDVKDKVKKEEIKEKPKAETIKKQVKDSGNKPQKSATTRKAKNTIIATPERIKEVEKENTKEQEQPGYIIKKRGRPKKKQ